MTTTAQQQQLQQQQQQQLKEGNENLIDNNSLSTFSFLPLQYSFGHRLKSTTILPPFSKLFFTGTTKQMLSSSAALKKDQQEVIHDEELCMFYIKLDTIGTKGNFVRRAHPLQLFLMYFLRLLQLRFVTCLQQ